MALTDKLSAIGNAIRGKTGGSSLLSLDDMATAITNLSTGSSTPTYHFAYWSEDINSYKYDTGTYDQHFVIDVATNMGQDFTSTTPFIIIMPWSSGTNTNAIGYERSGIITYDGTNLSISACPWHPYPNTIFYSLAAHPHTFTNNLAVNGTVLLDVDSTGQNVGSSSGSSWINYYLMIWGF